MLIGAIILAGAVIGIGFIRFGMRGQRVGHEPRCPKCEYDLSGKPDDSSRCSECGADLQAKNAIVCGRFNRRWGFIVLGLLILLCCTTIGTLTLRRVDFTPYKPTGWLIRDARNGTWMERDTAFSELIRRTNTGSISNAKLNELIQLALAEQLRGGQYWLPNWGEIIEAAWLTGHLSTNDQDTYIRQAVGLNLRVLSPVHRGDPVTLLAELDQGRLGMLLIRGSLDWAEVRVDGNVVKVNVAQSAQPYEFRLQSYAWGGTLPGAWLPAEFTKDLSSGEHQITCTWTLKLRGDAVLGNPRAVPVTARDVTKTLNGFGTLKVVERGAVDH